MKNVLTTSAGVCGQVSVLSYLAIAFFDLPDSVTFLLAMLFPITGIAFIYFLKEYIASVYNSHINKLSYFFGSFGYLLCSILLAAQLAVQIGVDVKAGSADRALLATIKENLRLIDMGIDVAWDMFISTYMILFLFATLKVKLLKWWGVASCLLGLALMTFNVICFPYPPNESGLIDAGPFIALFWMMLSIRMLLVKKNQLHEAQDDGRPYPFTAAPQHVLYSQ